MHPSLIIFYSIGYLLLLFGIAFYVENKAKKGSRLFNNPYVYSLSLAVYCTAWTFYGSVGKVTASGVEFLYIYLGPTFGAPILMVVMRKIIRISKRFHITSIADFIATRFGKNISLGVMVASFSIIGVIPYIAIQLKAIHTSIKIVLNASGNNQYVNFTNGIILIFLTIFIILFGTRKIDFREKHEGLVTAIAFESIVKLVSFIIVGLGIVFVYMGGWSHLMETAKSLPSFESMTTFNSDASIFQYGLLMTLSLFAFLFLPRQFQVGVVENVSENHLKKAVWIFPLYLLLINLFVLPIAFSGKIILGNFSNPDTFILDLPKFFNSNILIIFAYIGGFSAASSMIVVETIAISIMMSNNIVAPVFLSSSNFKEQFDIGLNKWVKNIRRIGILLIIIMSLLYERFIAEKFSLVSVGLISFTAVAQFAPIIIGGLYWKRATKSAAVAALFAGFVLWFYTLIIPSLVKAGYIPGDIMNHGLLHIAYLKPQAIFGITQFDLVTHGFLLSIGFNVLFFIGVSLFTERSPQEIIQATLFVDEQDVETIVDQHQVIMKKEVNMNELRMLMYQFLGKDRTSQILQSFEKKHNITLQNHAIAPSDLIDLVERFIAGNIGSVSAKLVMSDVGTEKEVSTREVIKVIQESQAIKASNEKLVKQSIILEKLSNDLRLNNEQMKKNDLLKDEFLYTVTHELRTPLTSIRALGEILQDNPDLEEPEKNSYLDAIVKETERLSHLINQVLVLERYESGKHHLRKQKVDCNEIVNEVLQRVDTLKKEKGLKIDYALLSLPSIDGDWDLLFQVIYNLLTNAIKFAKETIVIKGVVESGKIKISIIDDGECINPIDLPHLFDKFFQSHNQTIKKPHGSGLGLAISKKIIEMHNGKIYVESTEGNGTIFSFELPLKSFL